MRTKILCGLIICLLLGACGKVSKPIPPEGSTYPENYVITQNDD